MVWFMKIYSGKMKNNIDIKKKENEEPFVSFIVNSIDESRFASFQEGIIKRLPQDYIEVIRIKNAKSMAEGYNRGAERAKGKWFIFCHDDVAFIGKNPWVEILRATQVTDVFGVCGTKQLVSGNWYDAGIPFIVGSVVAPDPNRTGKYELQIFSKPFQQVVMDIQAVDGILIACRRSCFDALLGFDEKRFTDFHGYDTEFSFRASLAGLRVGVAEELVLLHDSDMGEFSQDKMKKWEEAQSIICERFGQYFPPNAGDRSHQAIPLEVPSDALDILRHL